MERKGYHFASKPRLLGALSSCFRPRDKDSSLLLMEHVSEPLS